MPKIALLSEETINQIAAGEVIEDPASVVKELVENSIDAGAQRIVIDIQGGGYKLIRISDDGSGMDSEDALACIQRHATSKLREAKDLLQLDTMGFRGEALAAIASVSKMTILTSPGGDLGTRVVIEGGRVLSHEPAARQRGTTIEVRDLFYNTPARHKFQKSYSASSGEITRIITFLSLAHPYMALELNQGGKAAIHSLPIRSSSLLDILQHRMEEMANLKAQLAKPIEHIEGPLSITGWLQTADQSRHNRSGQYLFINHRPVSCPALSYAVKEGYGTRIHADRFPAFVLHVRMDAQWLDVNVHPQKKEVRIRDEGTMRQIVREAVNRALTTPAPNPYIPPVAAWSFAEESANYSSLLMPSSWDYKPKDPLVWKQEAILKEENLHVVGLYKNYLWVESVSLYSRRKDPAWKEGGICLIDLNAALERVFSETMQQGTSSSAAQHLLMPIALSFAPHQISQLEEKRDLLENIGITFSIMGKQHIQVESSPPHCGTEEVQAILESLLEEQPSSKNIPFSHVHFRKKNFVLQEALELLEKLWICSDPWHTPQGRPIAIFMDEERLAHLFRSG